MGDRVEEKREAERLDRNRLEQKATETKRTDTTREFGKQMASIQQTKTRQGSQEQGRQQQRSRASVRLLVRAGIANQKQGQKLYTEGETRMLKQRDTEHGKEAELAARSAQQQKGSLKGNQRPNELSQPVSGRDARGNRDKSATGRQATETRREQVVATQGGFNAVMGTDGVSPKQSSGGAGAARLTPQQIIDQIVKSVRQGVDAKGLGMMHIELKDDVLAGANLSIQATHDGVALKVQSSDDTVSRLLSSGATAHELAVALNSKGIHLKALEVNDNKVIG